MATDYAEQLRQLVKRARPRDAAMIARQRESFVYGNLKVEEPRLTRDEVMLASERMGGWGGDDEPPDPRRVAAAANLARLHARVERDVAARLQADRLTPALICEYHAIAMAGLVEPGQVRTAEVVVGSRFGSVVFHEPPPAPRWRLTSPPHARR